MCPRTHSERGKPQASGGYSWTSEAPSAVLALRQLAPKWPMSHAQLEALRGHFGNELRASDGALASSQAELAATRSLLADAQGQLRHNAQHEHERCELAHLRQASYDSHARADWRQPPHVGSSTSPIAVGLLLQEVRELERCS